METKICGACGQRSRRDGKLIRVGSSILPAVVVGVLGVALINGLGVWASFVIAFASSLRWTRKFGQVVK